MRICEISSVWMCVISRYFIIFFNVKYFKSNVLPVIQISVVVSINAQKIYIFYSLYIAFGEKKKVKWIGDQNFFSCQIQNLPNPTSTRWHVNDHNVRQNIQDGHTHTHTHGDSGNAAVPSSSNCGCTLLHSVFESRKCSHEATADAFKSRKHEH